METGFRIGKLRALKVSRWIEPQLRELKDGSFFQSLKTHEVYPECAPLVPVEDLKTKIGRRQN